MSFAGSLGALYLYVNPDKQQTAMEKNNELYSSSTPFSRSWTPDHELLNPDYLNPKP